MSRALTPKERLARHRAAGTLVSVTLLDPDAVAALRDAAAVHGSIRAALEAALLGRLDMPPRPRKRRG